VRQTAGAADQQHSFIMPIRLRMFQAVINGRMDIFLAVKVFRNDKNTLQQHDISRYRTYQHEKTESVSITRARC
jgi:hypothetical protein